MAGKFSDVEFVSIGYGKSVHAPHVFVMSGEEFLGAACDQTPWARSGGGKRVRPIKAEAVTCARCKKVVAADE